MKRTLFPLFLTAVAAGGLGFFIRSAVAAVPTVDPVMSFTGRITNNGVPLPDGPQAIVVKVFDDATAGNLVCASPVTGPQVQDGRFTVSMQDCADKLTTRGNLWAEVNVSNVPIGRTKLGAVPYALEAAHAQTSASVTNWQPYVSRMIRGEDGANVANTTTLATYRRVGDTMELQIRTAFSGTPTGSSDYRWTLPDGATVDATKVPSVGDFPVGSAVLSNGGAIRVGASSVVLDGAPGTTLRAYEVGGAFYTSAGFGAAAGGSVALRASVPVL